MASGGEEASSDPLSSNPIFACIDQTLIHILINIEVQSREDIAQQIVDNIDGEDIDENRHKLFHLAVCTFEDTLRNRGMLVGKANLEPKSRRNDIVKARDIIDITLYLCGHKSEFPKDILSNKGERTLHVR